MGILDQQEKENIQATFIASLESIFSEKIQEEKWKKKLKNYNAKVNFTILGGDGSEEDHVHVSMTAKEGQIKLEPGKHDEPDFELIATFDIFFGIATGTINSIGAMLKGKLKATKMLKNLKNILILQKLLILKK
ncbi:MAG: SCP2 sterol-binding domain-containing protein [Promethearchaeota archaeon]